MSSRGVCRNLSWRKEIDRLHIITTWTITKLILPDCFSWLATDKSPKWFAQSLFPVTSQVQVGGRFWIASLLCFEVLLFCQVPKCKKTIQLVSSGQFVAGVTSTLSLNLHEIPVQCSISNLILHQTFKYSSICCLILPQIPKQEGHRPSTTDLTRMQGSWRESGIWGHVLVDL